MSDMGVERKPDRSAPSDVASVRERYAAQLPPDFPEPSPIPMLIRDIYQLSQRFERRLGATLAVNTTDLAAMEHLMENGPMTPSELATRLEMSTAATTHVIDRLVAVGHVQRQPHPVDRRKIVVIPAPASVARAFTELAPMIAGVGAAADVYDPEEQAVIAGFLRSVVELYEGLVDERPTSGS
ncbi:DNA-binding MarR family transcriptional regulator [Labedella gwakjiensis]|uniref:MarR family transcriptional regulator n=1 Tax=Labedella gwakjiensis TaxID=390269 RepID=A0A2P8GXD8_9MICO|nr:MarR family winged helix-turn-helix transcriptional regulator [Labedella gwakjiensis]PSL38615.1 DNA-binding MarR family transcriptional regulator [Labedella gwakjiensis]RUQ86881.1 MarR family transcriptional regulator [Labedella gwakjiensis]